jgi:hypothetical protein
MLKVNVTEGRDRKGKERKGKERKGEERKGEERKGERKGRKEERKGTKCTSFHSLLTNLPLLQSYLHHIKKH